MTAPDTRAWRRGSLRKCCRHSAAVRNKKSTQIQRDLRKRPTQETYKGDQPKRPAKETLNLRKCCRHSAEVFQVYKRDVHKSKETYTNQKKGTQIERDIHKSKETYANRKRRTQIKRDVHKSKETYTDRK